MYLERFGLERLPFRLDPDPRFLYRSAQHVRALDYLTATLAAGDGFAVLTGPAGVGKTTLVETLLGGLAPGTIVARLNQTQLSPVGFLQGVLVQFGFEPFSMTRAELATAAGQFLAARRAAGRRVVLVADEAQQLPDSVFEELRVLAGGEDGGPLDVVLAGKPALGERLDAAPLAALAARIRERSTLPPLDAADTAAYVVHRLAVAGAARAQLFSDEALALVHRHTGGVPRLVNALCDASMAAAHALEQAEVGAADVATAVGDLEWLAVATRTGRFAPDDPLAPARRPAPGARRPLGAVTLSLDGQVLGQRTLTAAGLTIGRDPVNDLPIESKYVSRQHCRILVDEGSVVIEDAGSTNGLQHGGRRVLRHVLRHGDVVVIGQHVLSYSETAPDEPGAPTAPVGDEEDTVSARGPEPAAGPAGGA